VLFQGAGCLSEHSKQFPWASHPLSSRAACFKVLQTNLAVPDSSLSLPTNLTFFVDLKATNFPSRFYRVLQQP
jgi:hypothetical protein